MKLLESAGLRFAPASHRPQAAARGAVVSLLFCALLAAPLCAFAATNRVGVLTANYSMSAGGSGQWSWDYYDAVGVDNGITDQDNVQLSISGQVKYVVLQTETNRILGDVISTTDQETVSGSEQSSAWPPLENDSYIYSADPAISASNLCVLIFSAPDASGRFSGICEENLMDINGYIEMRGSNGVNWPDIGGLQQGLMCAWHGEDEVCDFQFTLSDAAQAGGITLATNTTVNVNVVTVGFGGPDVYSGNATNSRTVTLQYVPDQLTVPFTATPTNGLVPLTVDFASSNLDSGSGTITNWVWTFGDGATGTGRNPSHTYTNARAFSVTLVATNSTGTAVQGIGSSNISVALPTVQISVMPTNGFEPLPVGFTCPQVDSGGNAIVSWLWNFGDGTTFAVRSPNQPATVTHFYRSAKTFQAKLTVTNEFGTAISTNAPKIVVSPPPTLFTASPTNGLAPLPVQFGGPGKDSLGNTITNWHWVFGDGSTGSGQNPRHTYSPARIYWPVLFVTNTLGSNILAFGPTISAGCSEIFGGGGGGTDFDSNGNLTNSAGTHPMAAVTVSGTRLYGVMSGGGSGGSGTIFAVNSDGSGFTNLHAFGSLPIGWYTNYDGATPQARMVLSGNTLYGAASSGGTNSSGTLFRINTDGSGFATLFNFPDGVTGGGRPNGLALSGNLLYGTTANGGQGDSGTIFKVNTNGAGFTRLHDFSSSDYNPAAWDMTNADGAYPAAALVLSGTTLYGTAPENGSGGAGTVFSVGTDGSGFAVLHSFTNSDGASPSAELLLAGDMLYGTTTEGGSGYGGTVFQIGTDGTRFGTLHNFPATISDGHGNYTNSGGAAPYGALILSGGWLYGTTESGGNAGSGTIFAVSPDGSSFTNLYNFSAPDPVARTNFDGANPYAGLALSGSTLYATTCNGGSTGGGALFAWSLLAASAPVQFQASPTNGAAPWPVQFAGPAADSQGSLLTNWSWSFGDGSSSALQNPSHTYVTGGVFAPSLVANNQNGGMVVGFGPEIAVTAPTVQFTVNPTNGGAPLTVQFVCPGLDSTGSAIASWYWDFGDGSVGTGSSLSHVYANAGDYSPSLVATNLPGAVVQCAGPAAISIVGTSSGLVWNGDFETGDFLGWTRGGIMNDSFPSSSSQFAHSGNYGLELLGMYGYASTLSQTLTTTPGAAYLLSFWLNNPAGNQPNQFSVSWDGRTVWGVTNCDAIGWTNVQIAVAAGGSSTALQFTFEPSVVFGLDDVSVVLEACPPPGIVGINFLGRNLAFSATNGQVGGSYCVLMSTNLALPLSQWTPLTTQCLDAGGNFTITVPNAFDSTAPQRFYQIRSP